MFQESSSAQFGPKFKALPPITTNFTSLALTGNILQPRSPTDNPKRFKTDAPLESISTSVTTLHYDIRSTSMTPTSTNFDIEMLTIYPSSHNPSFHQKSCHVNYKIINISPINNGYSFNFWYRF